MRWLQSAFSSSSSSSKSHSPSNSNPDIDSLLSRLALFSGSNHRLRCRQRRLTRSKKLRHLSDDAVCPHLYRSSSSYEGSSFGSASGGPQPLPLPELDVLLHRDVTSNSNTGNVPLPSPNAALHVGGVVKEDRRKFDAFNGDASRDCIAPLSLIGRRSVFQDAQPSVEHSEINSSGKSPRERHGGKRNQGKYRIDIPFSAPTSPYSCSALSPQRNAGEVLAPCYMIPQPFQAWSAPEMAPADATLSLDYHYQMYPEKTNFSVDSSPLHSPRQSPGRSTRSPSGPASQPSVESSTRHECNGQANVHPLPLPPGAVIQDAMTLQPTPVSTLSPKPEVMPVKNQWKKGKLIGRGTFGSVYVASNRETGALCAMKEVEILPDDSQSAERIRQLEQEIKVLSHLKHPNIVQYYGSEIVGNHFYIYLEYVHPGSINKYINDHCGAITESVVRNFTRHILCGLAYLHSTKTIHRDIKGPNLLVDASGVVKLADFGMAKHLTGQAANLSLKGSPYWMAPELLQSVMQKDASSDLALAVDIWSLGCTIIEMLNGKPPWSEYEGAAAMFKVLKETPPIPETLSAEGKDFLRCCFRRNPAERPSASKLLEHQFVKNLQQLDVSSCTLSLNAMKLTDKTHIQREHSNYKLDPLPSSSDAQSTKGNLANSETGQWPYQETANLIPVSHPSPGSALKERLTLSSPSLSHSTDHPSPSVYMNCT